MQTEISPSTARATIRALFLDVDGTLLGAGTEVSPGVKQAVRQAQDAGCEIALCTGRSRFTAEPVAAQLNLNGYIVTSNGGVVMRFDTGEIVLRRLLSIPIALELVRAIVDAGENPYVYQDATQSGADGARILYHPERTISWATDARYRPHADILTSLPFDPVSVSAFGPPETLRPLADRLRAELAGRVSIIESGSLDHWGLEIFATGVSKQTGLAAVADRIGVSRENIMGIGDHMNDLEMIRWVGLGVAMGNAIPEILAAADFVTASVEEDGVARAIERFIVGSDQ